MRRTLQGALAAGVLLVVGGGVQAWRLLHPAEGRRPLPSGLTALDTPQGQALLRASAPSPDYAALQATFQPQTLASFCGVASSVAVLNALQGTALDQESLFTPQAEQVRSAWQVTFGGMTLAQLAGLLRSHGAGVQLHLGDALTVAQLRAILADNLARAGDYVVVNYHRPALGQPGGGHISPLAAYDPTADQVLVMDTAAYRYPPTWVSVSALHAAMQPVDRASGQARGLVVVSR